MQKKFALDNEPIVVLDSSLNVIKRAHNKLRDLRGPDATPDDLVSQIRLCDLLLNEISCIRTRLKKGIHAGAAGRTYRVPHGMIN
jgi:hypothetical protein